MTTYAHLSTNTIQGVMRKPSAKPAISTLQQLTPLS